MGGVAVLGELEQAVMDVLWGRSEALSVREVHAALSNGRELAYTTVMTVLDRLAKKGIVVRNLDGRAWHYRPALSRAELVSAEILAMLADLAPGLREQVWRAVTENLAHPVAAR